MPEASDSTQTGLERHLPMAAAAVPGRGFALVSTQNPTADTRPCPVRCGRTFLACLAGLAMALGACGCLHAVKPLPVGLDYAGATAPVPDLRFIRDLTWIDGEGTSGHEQEIFDEILAIIGSARRILLVEMFLFNDFLGSAPPPIRPLCEELTQALVSRKREVPELEVIVVTDPVNTVYGGIESSHLQRLEAAGIQVVLTDLDRLRDSNPLWSGIWRAFVKPWGNSPNQGTVASPFGHGKVTRRSWLRLLNFKANHRKVVLADRDGGYVCLVTSANAHDGSSAHGNIALVFGGRGACEAFLTEKAVLAFSSKTPLPTVSCLPGGSGNTGTGKETGGAGATVQIVTEQAIGRSVEQLIGEAAEGDCLDIVMFYLSDRRVVRALKRAARRGANLRVVLDPNKDAFGRIKKGLPNRQVARELTRAGIAVRWADTHGEQSHAKLIMLRGKNGDCAFTAGSANFTRRNLRNYNLETNVVVRGRESEAVIQDVRQYVDMLWENRDGRLFTVGYNAYRDDSRWKVLEYRFKEFTGLCTW